MAHMATRYGAFNQALHWFTALLMFAAIITGWVQINRPLTAGIFTVFNWHKTLGLIVLALTVVRMVWRRVDPPPPYPPNISAWNRRLAHTTYAVFYLLLFWMPLTGYMMSQHSGHPPRIFDVFETTQFFRTDIDRSNFFAELHFFGQWVLYALIALHVAGVVFHLLCRDGMLSRMLPPQALYPPPYDQEAASRNQRGSRERSHDGASGRRS